MTEPGEKGTRVLQIQGPEAAWRRVGARRIGQGNEQRGKNPEPARCAQAAAGVGPAGGSALAKSNQQKNAPRRRTGRKPQGHSSELMEHLQRRIPARLWAAATEPRSSRDEPQVEASSVARHGRAERGPGRRRTKPTAWPASPGCTHGCYEATGPRCCGTELAGNALGTRDPPEPIVGDRPSPLRPGAHHPPPPPGP